MLNLKLKLMFLFNFDLNIFLNFVKDTKQKVEMLKTMQDIFFGIPYELFYQATKWEIAAVHGSGGLRCQKCMRSGAYRRLPIHYHYVLSEEEKNILPNIHVIQQPSMVHLKGLS